MNKSAFIHTKEVGDSTPQYPQSSSLGDSTERFGECSLESCCMKAENPNIGIPPIFYVEGKFVGCPKKLALEGTFLVPNFYGWHLECLKMFPFQTDFKSKFPIKHYITDTVINQIQLPTIIIRNGWERAEPTWRRVNFALHLPFSTLKSGFAHNAGPLAAAAGSRQLPKP